MDAIEDAKGRQSVVSDTLRQLTDKVSLLHGKIDLLGAGQSVNRAQVVADLGGLLDLCQNLRDAIFSEDSAAAWKSRSELLALVERLDHAASKRNRYLMLAQILANGTVSHRREQTRKERLAQRDEAVAELMEMSALTSPPDLPGPSQEKWLEWACGLDDNSNVNDIQILKDKFPRVDNFVRQLDIELWHDGPSPAADRSSPVEAIRSSTPGAARPAPPSGKDAAFNHSAPVSPSLHFEEPAPLLAPQIPAAHAGHEPQPEPSSVAQAKDSQKDSNKLSFFDPSEVEELSRLLKQSKSDPRQSRKVRSLLAISHWLQPHDQNPLHQSVAGIRAQLNYTGSSDLVASSPAEAEKSIQAHNELLLFTGGADLLRWSLSHGANSHLDAVAPIRRLRADHLRTWFNDLNQIALAEPQVHDIETITSGIPLLVGELHRLIIPFPDAPPSWLGYAIWTEIKAGLARRLPSIAQDLRNGSPAIRLTAREMTLLKMIVIASDHSTPETLASNLMENWDQKNHPEFAPATDADENSIALLESLGLVPMRHGSGLTPIKALLPVEPGDAIRQVVGYL